MTFILLPSEIRQRAICLVGPKAAGKHPSSLELQNIGSVLLSNFRTHLPCHTVPLRSRPQYEYT